MSGRDVAMLRLYEWFNPSSPMPSYRYTVINQENKQLTGLINAASEQGARSELNSLGFSILSINLHQEADFSNQKSKTKFEFTALNKKGKKIIGSIPAADRYPAFKKLITEYGFKVLSLVKSDLPEAEKKSLQLAGVSDLENQYQAELTIGDKSSALATEAAKKNLQTLTIKEIDDLLNKIKNLIDQHQENINPTQKKDIDELMGKILRLKTSSNLNVIKESCRELLAKLQQDDTLLNPEANLSLKNHLALESKKLLLQVNRLDDKSKSVFTSGDGLQKIIKTMVAKTPWLQKIITAIIEPLSHSAEIDPEMSTLKKTLRLQNSQLWDYLKIWLTAKADLKPAALAMLKELWQERKNTIQAIRKTHHRSSRKKGPIIKGKNRLLEEINTFSGWLLAFYLLYYFLALYISTKNLGLAPSLNFQLFHSKLIKYLIVGTFLFHGGASLKLTFLKDNRASGYIIFPSTLLLFLLIISNF